MVIDFAGVAVGATWHGESSLAWIGAILILQGVGIGLFQVAYADIVIGTLPPEERGVASSLTSLTRTLGVVTCAAIGSALFSAGQQGAVAAGVATELLFLAGYRHAFAAIAAGAALFALLTLLRPRAWFPR